MTKRLAPTIKPRRITSDYFGGIIHNADSVEMPTENKRRRFDLNPTLFRDFATECIELSQSTASREQCALFLEMSNMWQQMAQRWEENG